MKRAIAKKMIFPVFLILLTGLALFFSILQIQWLKQAAETEQTSIRKDMRFQAAEALEQVRLDLDNLYSLAIDAYSAEDQIVFDESQADFFSPVLRSCFVLETESDTGVTPLYGDVKEEYFSIIPEVQAALAEGKTDLLWENLFSGQDFGWIVRPVDSKGARTLLDDLRHSRPVTLVLFILDSRMYIDQLVVPSLEENITDYPYLLEWNSLSLSGGSQLRRIENDVLSDRTPDLVIPVDFLFGPDFRPPQNEGAFRGRGSDFNLGDILNHIKALPIVNEQTVPSDDQPHLAVFYPDISLDLYIRGRLRLNMMISIGLLIVLIGSILFIYYLYRQQNSQRMREQEFVASVSHELRTPITVIKAAGQNLKEGRVAPAERIPVYGEEIFRQSERLERMVESVLLFSGIQMGRDVNRIDLDLEEHMRSVITSLTPVAEKAEMELTFSAEGSPQKTRLDPDGIRLILENLVMNAILHSGGSRIKVQLIRKSFGTVHLTVTDNGRGIPVREQRKIFSPFVRGGASIRDQHPGSGLGLHLVKRLAVMMDGSVLITKTAEQGVCFTVILNTGGAV